MASAGGEKQLAIRVEAGWTCGQAGQMRLRGPPPEVRTGDSAPSPRHGTRFDL